MQNSRNLNPANASRILARTMRALKFEQCQIGCWDRYEVVIKEKECLEKDRKIDWSATMKIECYIDILLHDYTKEELLTKCGSETCVEVAREEDYQHCHTICLEVDHEGEWPAVHAVNMACGAPGSCDALPPQATQYPGQTAWIEVHTARCAFVCVGEALAFSAEEKGNCRKLLT